MSASHRMIRGPDKPDDVPTVDAARPRNDRPTHNTWKCVPIHSQVSLRITLTRPQLMQAEPLLTSENNEPVLRSSAEGWSAFADAKTVPQHRTRALSALTELAERYGVVHELDVQVLANKLAGSAASALRQTYAELVALQRSGRLESPEEAQTISEGLLLQLESKQITGRVAAHVQRVAGLDLYRLFDRPGRDDE